MREITISGRYIVGNESYSISFHFPKDTERTCKSETNSLSETYGFFFLTERRILCAPFCQKAAIQKKRRLRRALFITQTIFHVIIMFLF